MAIAFLVLSSLCIISTFIALLYKKSWWIRLFDFPRVQIIVLQLISFIGLSIFIHSFPWYVMLIIAFLIVTTIIQIVYVFPYLPIAKKDLPASDKNPRITLSLMVSNVKMKNRKCEPLLDLINKYNPDIFLAVETDSWWDDVLKALDKSYKFTVKEPLDNTYGMLLFSKIPLKNAKVKHIVKEDVPSIHADVLMDKFDFRLCCLHPEPPTPSEAGTSSPRDRELIRLANLIREKPKPHIVLGDLNDVAWSDSSYKFERLSKLIDPRKGRGFYNTFHAGIPLLRWALDHIFVSKEFRVIKLKRLPNIYSDHFPMYFKFGINASYP